jgi:hypothetical protein
MALNMTAVWCHAVGRPLTDVDVDHLRTMFAAG